MPRTTTFVFDTTGGAPVFHIPIPISSLAALTGDDSDGEPQHVKFVFRNSGGNPTFHVGGAEVGIGPGEVLDYATVARAVMCKRHVEAEAEKHALLGVGEGVQVQVEIEEETPRVPRAGKGKEREREAEKIQGADLAYQIIDVSTPRPPPAFRSIPSRRNYSREEQEALQRGPLTIATLSGAYEEGRREFALQCTPELPDTRMLSAEEDAEWRALWDEMLRLDRWFSGPLRDTHVIKALQRATDELTAAAVQRLHRRAPAPSENTAGLS
ncbi:hypothetical protein B0H19DRAFT_684454 [Mycena capillaripes]|nr:hypothetical protein B0H19DRAFT_684454 [Mycena capillaripes]